VHRKYIVRKIFAVQVKKCADAGADIVRITVQGKKEAQACADIRRRLFEDGYASNFFSNRMQSASPSIQCLPQLQV
jgi:hypothetical protein